MKLTPITPSDTGWRNISHLITEQTSPALSLLIRRIRETVYIRCDAFMMPAGTEIQIPLGMAWKAATNSIYREQIQNGSIQIAWDGNHSLLADTSGQIVGTVSYLANAPWPTTLPGIPAQP